MENQNLSEILLARERRVKRQKELLDEFHSTLISFTLNIPGPVKNSYLYRKIHQEGVRLLIEAINVGGQKVIFKEVRSSAGGDEAFIVVDYSPIKVKKTLIEIENNHPLGRLFDFDVYDRGGKAKERSEMGIDGRKCLLCDDLARVCCRSRKHSIEDLLKKIYQMAEEYFQLNLF